MPSSRDRVRRHRERLRRQGLRPVQIWVPDVRAPEFIAEARRACLAANRSPTAKEDQDFVDSVSILNYLPDDDIPEFRLPE